MKKQSTSEKYERIRVLFLEELKTLEEIGKIYGVSRQYIYQVIHKQPWFSRSIVKETQKRRSERDMTMLCKYCGKSYRANFSKRRFCSRECFLDFQFPDRPRTSEDKKRWYDELNRRRATKHYHEIVKRNPELLKKHYARTKDYRARVWKKKLSTNQDRVGRIVVELSHELQGQKDN